MSLASPSGPTGKRRRTDSEDKNNSANANATSPVDASTSSQSQSQSQSQPPSSSLPAHIPKRGARACTACRKGKNRCEGEAPCRRCQLSGTLCVFEKPEKKNVVPMPTNTLDRISRIESQYLIMQSTMIGMQSSLDRIFSAIQMNTAAGTTSTSSSQSFSPIDEPKKFPPLPGFAPPPHKYATYGILPSTAPSSDDESEDTLPRATMNAPIEALQGLANAAAEAAAAAATAPIPVPPRVKKRRKAEPIPRNAFPSVLEKGLVSESEAQELYHIFFSGCHLFIPLFDPAFDTYEGLKERTPFCFDAILAVASKIRSGNGPPTPTFFKCLEEAQGIARSTLFGPIVRKEAVQAMLLLSAWSTNGWLPCGHAMRMALDLGLHRALDKLADSGSLQVGNTNDRAEDFMNTSPGGSLRDDIIDIDMPEHTNNNNNSNVNGTSRNRARSMSGSASASASGSGSGSGSVTPPPASSGTPSTLKSQQSTATSTTKTQSGPTPSSDSTHPIISSTSNPNIKKRSEEEERDLVVSARIWLCLYWFDHQLSLGTGRPIVLRNDNSIKHCRLLLSHPMSSPTDVRLVAQIELIMQKTQIYETLSSIVSDRQTATSNTNNTSSSSSSSSSTIINIIRRAQIGLDKWWAEWDALHASQGHPPHSLLRKILSSELYYAKLWLVCVALRGASWDKLPFEQREMAFQAKEAASRCLEVFLGCTEYRAALRYAVHDSLVTAAFSGLFLLKMAHLFPAEVDIAAIAMQVEQLAGLLSDVAAERYAVTLRLMLLNLRRKMGLGVGYVSYNGAGSGSGNGNGNASGNSVHPSQQQQMSNLGRSQGQVYPESIPPQQQQQQQQIGMGSLPIPSTVLVSPTHTHSHSHSHSHLQPQHTHPHAQLHAQLHVQHTQAQHQQQSHPHQHQHISHSHSHSHLHPQQHVHHPHSHSHPHQQLPHTHNIDTLSVVPPPQSYLDPAHTQSIAIGSGIPNGVPGIISPSQYTQGPSNPNSNSNSNANVNVNANQANSTMLASINTTAEDFGFVWPSDADGGMFSPSMVPLWLQEQSLSDLGIPINGTDGIFLNFSGVGMSGWNGDFVGMPEAW